MRFLNAFIVSFGGMLAASAIVVAWLFRTSSAPLVAKIAIPTILVALACWSPTTVNSLLGLPLTASFDELPERAELVAFVAQTMPASRIYGFGSTLLLRQAQSRIFLGPTKHR